MEIKACPFCDCEITTTDELSEGSWVVICRVCGACGPAAQTEKLAILSWNARGGKAMEIKKCPFCGNENLEVKGNNTRFVCCERCGTYGPDAKSDEEAVRFWNAAPRKEDVEMGKSCGDCKYNLDGYCSSVPPYKSFRVNDDLCCTDWEAKESKSTPLNEENPSGKPFIDLARDELDVIQTLETKVNEYLMAAEEAAELAQAMLKYCRACGHGSWTPLNPKDATDAVIEEYADLLLAMEASFPRHEGNKMFYNNLERVYKEKAKRWAERLKERGEE